MKLFLKCEIALFGNFNRSGPSGNALHSLNFEELRLTSSWALRCPLLGGNFWAMVMKLADVYIIHFNTWTTWQYEQMASEIWGPYDHLPGAWQYTRVSQIPVRCLALRFRQLEMVDIVLEFWSSGMKMLPSWRAQKRIVACSMLTEDIGRYQLRLMTTSTNSSQVVCMCGIPCNDTAVVLWPQSPETDNWWISICY